MSRRSADRRALPPNARLTSPFAPRPLAPLHRFAFRRGVAQPDFRHRRPVILDSVATRTTEEARYHALYHQLLIALALLGIVSSACHDRSGRWLKHPLRDPDRGESSGGVFARLMTGLEAQLGGRWARRFSRLLRAAACLSAAAFLSCFAGHLVKNSWSYASYERGHGRRRPGSHSLGNDGGSAGRTDATSCKSRAICSN